MDEDYGSRLCRLWTVGADQPEGIEYKYNNWYNVMFCMQATAQSCASFDLLAGWRWILFIFIFTLVMCAKLMCTFWNELCTVEVDIEVRFVLQVLPNILILKVITCQFWTFSLCSHKFYVAWMCFQLLKLFYRAPYTSQYHQQVWSRIGAKADPLIHRFAPVLERPLDYVRNWFLN